MSRHVNPGAAPAEGREAGFVLPAVLAILIVVCGLLAAAVLRVRAGTGLTQARAGITRMQGVADAVVRLLAYDLAVQRTYRTRGLGMPEDGTPFVCALGERERVVVALQDQGRLIDLNTTPRAGLEDGFRALGVDDRDALTLAAEIVDYRDPDDVPEPSGGAEAPQYKARGLGYGPRNAPFVSVDEIGRLPAMTDRLAAILKPALTVYNEAGRFDPVRLAAALRPAGARHDARAAGPPVPSPRQYFRIDAVAEAAGLRAGRSAVYGLGGSSTGTSFLTWQPAVPALRAPAGSHPACAAIAAALTAR